MNIEQKLEPEQKLEAEQKISDRRKFLKSAGVTGLGLAAAGFAAGKMGAFDNTPAGRALGLKTQKVEAASAITDVDILNFALNLEYLEAEFYTICTYGGSIADFGIGTSGTGTPGPTTGGAKVVFDTSVQNINSLYRVAEELAHDEQTHVTLLRKALGSSAVAKPAINLDALGANLYYGGVKGFLILARAFEDTGVSAYGGAAALITSKEYLQAAAQIALTEALHAGNLRLFINLFYVMDSPIDSHDVVPGNPYGSHYFTTDANALAIVRTPSEVLSIVYANSNPGTTGGGFFPNGVNGNINTV